MNRPRVVLPEASELFAVSHVVELRPNDILNPARCQIAKTDASVAKFAGGKLASNLHELPEVTSPVDAAGALPIAAFCGLKLPDKQL